MPKNPFKSASPSRKFKSAANDQSVKGVTQSAAWRQPLKKHINPATSQIEFVTILVRVLSGDSEHDFHARFPPHVLYARDVCSAIAEKERLSGEEPGLFSLWVISKDLEMQMRPDQDIFLLMSDWHRWVLKYTHFPEAEDPSHQINRHWFIYRREAAVTLGQENGCAGLEAVNLLFGEAKRNILTKRYCCSTQEASTVAGYQLQIAYGDYDVEKCPPGVDDRLTQLLPIGTVSKLRPVQWEAIITVQYKSFLGLSLEDCRRGFLRFAQSMPCYGSSFFPVCKELPPSGFFEFRTQNWFFGVGANGVCIIDWDLQKYIYAFTWAEVSCETGKDLLILTRTVANKAKIISLITPQCKLIENLMIQIKYRLDKEARKLKNMIVAGSGDIIKSVETDNAIPTTRISTLNLNKGSQRSELAVAIEDVKEPIEKVVIEVPVPPLIYRNANRSTGRPKFRTHISVNEENLIAQLDAAIQSVARLNTVAATATTEEEGEEEDVIGGPVLGHLRIPSSEEASKRQSRYGKIGQSPLAKSKLSLSDKPTPLFLQGSTANLGLGITIDSADAPVSELQITSSLSHRSNTQLSADANRKTGHLTLLPRGSPTSGSPSSSVRLSVFGTTANASSSIKKNRQSMFGGEGGVQINRRSAYIFNLDENMGGVGPTELLDMRFKDPK